MSLTAEAVTAIQALRAEMIARLTRAADEARAKNILATRTALTQLAASDTTFAPIADILAATLTIGRDSDDYPERNVSQEAKDLYAAAIRADGYTTLPESAADAETGLLAVLYVGGGKYHSPSVDLDRITQKEHRADLDAWSDLTDYEKHQLPLPI